VKKRGFTLIELMVAMVVGLAAITSVYSLGAALYQSALHGERTRQDLFRTVGRVEGAQPSTAVNGTLNGKPFTYLSDADPRVGARLEVFAAGQYTWVPFEHLAKSPSHPSVIIDNQNECHL